MSSQQQTKEPLSAEEHHECGDCAPVATSTPEMEGPEQADKSSAFPNPKRRVRTPSRRKKNADSSTNDTDRSLVKQPPILPTLGGEKSGGNGLSADQEATPSTAGSSVTSMGQPNQERGTRHSPLNQQPQQRLQTGDGRSPRQPDFENQLVPTGQRSAQNPSNATATTTTPTAEFDDHFRQQEQEDLKFVQDFWRTYDDLLFLSLFTQLGVVARLASSTWFTYFEGVFTADSALFTNLPLNCLSCFILGTLCSGESCMEIISTRFSPPRLQQHYHKEKLADDPSNEEGENGEEGEYDHHYKDGSSSPSSTYGMAPMAGRPVPSPPLPLRSMQGESRGSPDYSPGGFPTPLRHELRRRQPRRTQRDKHRPRFFRSWKPPVDLNEELRDVQLLALERRIRQSKCLVLFPVYKEDVDVMEHYFDEGYKKHGHGGDNEDEEVRQGNRTVGDDEFFDEDVEGQSTITSYGYDLEFEESVDASDIHQPSFPLHPVTKPQSTQEQAAPPYGRSGGSPRQDPLRPEKNPIPNAHGLGPKDPTGDTTTTTTNNDHVELHGDENQLDLNQIVHEVSANVTENVTRLSRVNIANGWDVGTTAEDMSDDIMLGFRFGFCGALSSFSSWNSAMINLIGSGRIGEAFVGYMLGLQLPIIAYRFGQHIAVYIFVWRCRREAKLDERRGYGIRLNTQEEDLENLENASPEMNGMDRRSVEQTRQPVDEASSGAEEALPGSAMAESRRSPDPEDQYSPSIRAIVTVIFIMAVVTQCTSISFYSSPQNQLVALSLLFSPLGVLARWRLSKYNEWRPTFPIGTFTCNMLACALSGGLGRLLAGNPNEAERLVLVSLINGTGGTLSSVAAFVVEILAGVDPILFRFDGAIYALWSIFWAMLIGFLFSASADWADATGGDS